MAAPAPTPEQWLKAFNVLDAMKNTNGRWETALACVPGVGKTTLYDRYQKRYAGPTIKGPGSVLGEAMEKVIVEWLRDQQTVNNCVPIDKLVKVARKAAQEAGLDPSSVGGSDWLKRFWKRHPDLTVRQSQLADTARTTSVTSDNVQRFYDLLGVALEGVKRENVHMADETGFAARRTDRRVSPSAEPSAEAKLFSSFYQPLPLFAGYCPKGLQGCLNAQVGH
jgi:hypothetical protein